MYHEAAAVGLLETVLFHEDGAQCVSEVAGDLIDYAVEQLTALLALIKLVICLEIVESQVLDSQFRVWNVKYLL